MFYWIERVCLVFDSKEFYPKDRLHGVIWSKAGSCFRGQGDSGMNLQNLHTGQGLYRYVYVLRQYSTVHLREGGGNCGCVR